MKSHAGCKKSQLGHDTSLKIAICSISIMIRFIHKKTSYFFKRAHRGLSKPPAFGVAAYENHREIGENHKNADREGNCSRPNFPVPLRKAEKKGRCGPLRIQPLLVYFYSPCSCVAVRDGFKQPQPIEQK